MAPPDETAPGRWTPDPFPVAPVHDGQSAADVVLVVEAQPISTSVSPRQRAVSVLLDNGVTDRYCLMRRKSGEVHWVLDSFKGGAWTAHGGTLAVAEVIAHVPGAARDVIRWTEREIEDGVDVVEIDLFSRDQRRRSLERLAAELHSL